MILFFPLPVEVPKMMNCSQLKMKKKLRAGRGLNKDKIFINSV
jgi:hypothetical protein